MRHPNTLRPGETALIVVDLQEAFRGVVIDFDRIASRIAVMVQGAALLNVPILVTEQYPQRLGRTAQVVLNVLPADVNVVDKTAFSSCAAATFLEQLEATKAKQVLLCGLESHVCVNQTAHDLLASVYQVHLLMDCITSRKQDDRDIGIEKMCTSGTVPSSVEMALFELMRDSRHEQFKAVQRLIK